MKKTKKTSGSAASKGLSRSGQPMSLRIDAHTEIRPYYNPAKVRATSEQFVMGAALINGRKEIGQNIVDVSDKIYRLGMRGAIESNPGGDAFIDFLEQEGERLCHIMLTGKANALPGLGWYPRALVYARSGDNRAAAKRRNPGEPRGKDSKDTWRLRTAISLHPNVAGEDDGFAKRIIDQAMEHKMTRLDDDGDFIVLAISDREDDVDSDEGYPSTSFAAFHSEGGAWGGWIEHVDEHSTLGLTMDRKDLCMEMIENELSSLRVMSHLRREKLSDAAIKVLRKATNDDRSLGLHEKAIREGLEAVMCEIKEHVVSDLFMQLHVTESAHHKHISRMAKSLYEEMRANSEENEAARERDKRRHIDQIKTQEKQAKGYLERAARSEAEVARLFKQVRELQASQIHASSGNADGVAASKAAHTPQHSPTSGLPALWDEVFG